MNNELSVFSLGFSLLIIPLLIKNIADLFKNNLDNLQMILFAIFFLTHPIFIEVLLLNKFFTGPLPLLITVYALNLRKENSILYGHLGLLFAATLNPAYLLPALGFLIIDFKKLNAARMYLSVSFIVLFLFYFNQLNFYSHNLIFALGNFLNSFYFAFTHTLINVSLYQPISLFLAVSLLFLGFSFFKIIKQKIYSDFYLFLLLPFLSVFFYSIIYPYDFWHEAFSNHQNYLMVLLVLIYIFIKTMPRLIIYGFIFLNLYGSVNLVRNWFPISAQLEQDLSTLELKDNAKLLVQRTLSWQYFFEGNKEKALYLNQSLIENNVDDADLLRENIIFKKN